LKPHQRLPLRYSRRSFHGSDAVAQLKGPSAPAFQAVLDRFMPPG
jgi:hypothetical protein